MHPVGSYCTAQVSLCQSETLSSLFKRIHSGISMIVHITKTPSKRFYLLVTGHSITTDTRKCTTRPSANYGYGHVARKCPLPAAKCTFSWLYCALMTAEVGTPMQAYWRLSDEMAGTWLPLWCEMGLKLLHAVLMLMCEAVPSHMAECWDTR